MYCGPAHRAAANGGARPNYAEVAKQLARKGVTRRLLWSEYRDQHSEGIGYSVFCDELAGFLADRDLSYRNDHVPGQKAYFDGRLQLFQFDIGNACHKSGSWPKPVKGVGVDLILLQTNL